MFLQNKTSLDVALAHGNLGHGRSIGAVVVRTMYRAGGDRLALCEERLAPAPTDPPDLSRRALWLGVSVTAAGEVYGPSAAPYVRAVSLTIGEVSRTLAVFGDRRWTRGLLGELEASAPSRFEVLPLSFTRAYGGSVDIPPGLFPGTDLPFPGGVMGYALNETGIGFYPDEAAAKDSLLPSFELADQLVTRWSDRPMPGCFIPCPELPALRVAPPRGMAPAPMPAAIPASKGPPDVAITDVLRAIHHAPGYLVFDEVPPGTPVRLEGVGRRTIRFDVAPPPVRVGLRRGKTAERAPPMLRSVHVDADRGLVSCVHGYPFLYEEGRAPSWILVEA